MAAGDNGKPIPESPFPTWGARGIAACDHERASQAGCEVMAEGGNAVDAAVTVSLTLGVLCPQYTGVGGGGFMIVWLPEMKSPEVLDYRETAPAASHPTMFNDAPATASTRGPLAVGIPGTVAGLAEVLERYGTISWERALAPGIELAERGFPTYPNLRRVILGRKEALEEFPEAYRLFVTQTGEGPLPGQLLRLEDLAATYRRLAEHGPREFYEGETAQRIADCLQKQGGLITVDDLRGYQPVWRQPLHAGYRGNEVYTLGPPSGGGIQLLQILQMLEPFSFLPEKAGSAQTYHLQAEAMRISFADRSSWIADPDFYDIPASAMLDPARIAELHLMIDPERAIDLVETPPLEGFVPSGHSLPGPGGTASFATADPHGGFVVATESVNLWFGSMVVPEGTGIVLNNIMDDFSRQPGTPDAFGLVSSRINQIEPGKRAASSSCPALISRAGKPYIAAGSAGGPRIATSVYQIINHLIDHQVNVRQAMDAPRIHHQWLPNELVVEKFVPEDVRKRLRALGHRVVEGPSRSHGCSIMWDETDELFYGAGDFRSGGGAVGLD